MALGTVAAAVDLSFSTSSTLEVVEVEFNDCEDTLRVVGSPVGAAERFNRLAWGSPGDGSRKDGIIAGGFEDGAIGLWDPKSIFSGQGECAHLAQLQKHSAYVKGLMFNSFSPNLLASGAADGELCIWDLANPSEPSLYPALKGGNNHPTAEITNLCWNNKVLHILASTASDGSTVVWDLKRQRPVIRFADPQSRHRCSCLQWNPEVATQLIVASDDDRAPALQLWDLRNSVSPVKELTGHTKGVLSMAWNVHEPSIMLSSGKDNRSICWDMRNMDIAAELPPSSNWNFDLLWDPKLPGIFASASFDGQVSVHNILQCTGSGLTDVVNDDFSVSHVPKGPARPLRFVPKWLARPAGASFGFGGSLISFSNSLQLGNRAGQQPVTATVKRQLSISRRDSISRSERFENTIASGDKALLREYCIANAHAIADPDEQETWSFLRILFEEDARRQLQSYLGFTGSMGSPNLDDAGSSMAVELHETENISGNSNENLSVDGEEEVEAGEFFDKLGTPPISPQNEVLDAAECSAGKEISTAPGEEYVLKALYTA